MKSLFFALFLFSFSLMAQSQSHIVIQKNSILRNGINGTVTNYTIQENNIGIRRGYQLDVEEYDYSKDYVVPNRTSGSRSLHNNYLQQNGTDVIMQDYYKNNNNPTNTNTNKSTETLIDWYFNKK